MEKGNKLDRITSAKNPLVQRLRDLKNAKTRKSNSDICLSARIGGSKALCLQEASVALGIQTEHDFTECYNLHSATSSLKALAVFTIEA